MSEIGIALRLARSAVGAKQWEIASACGTHSVILNAIERGRRQANPVLARAVLRELNSHHPQSPLAARVLQDATQVVEKELAA